MRCPDCFCNHETGHFYTDCFGCREIQSLELRENSGTTQIIRAAPASGRWWLVIVPAGSLVASSVSLVKPPGSHYEQRPTMRLRTTRVMAKDIVTGCYMWLERALTQVEEVTPLEVLALSAEGGDDAQGDGDVRVRGRGQGFGRRRSDGDEAPDGRLGPDGRRRYRKGPFPEAYRRRDQPSDG